MIDPLTALIVGCIALVLMVAMIWPRHGILELISKGRRLKEREQIEDALKHLYDCEYKGVECMSDRLVRALSMSSADVAELLARLQARGLALSTGESFRLTSAGRGYALRIIRLHRLWETYLAERSGLAPQEWHDVAERREHDYSTADVEAISAELGNPTHDPHGDPIPTATGKMPPRSGVPLEETKDGQVVRVTHLEDEPTTIYAQLVAMGMYPGQVMLVVEVTQDRIRFQANGQEHVLAPALAANVTVVPVTPQVEILTSRQTLADLKLGETVRIAEISPTCQGLARRRLLDLGMIPGTEIQIRMGNPLGDPTAYLVRGTVIALRREQAKQIYVVSDTAAA